MWTWVFLTRFVSAWVILFYDFQLDLTKMKDLRINLDLEVEHQDLTWLRTWRLEWLVRVLVCYLMYVNTLSYLSKGWGKLANNTVTSQVLIPNKGQILDKTCSIMAELGTWLERACDLICLKKLLGTCLRLGPNYLSHMSMRSLCKHFRPMGCLCLAIFKFL